MAGKRVNTYDLAMKSDGTIVIVALWTLLGLFWLAVGHREWFVALWFLPPIAAVARRIYVRTKAKTNSRES
jgi:hypothetical protein